MNVYTQILYMYSACASCFSVRTKADWSFDLVCQSLYFDSYELSFDKKIVFGSKSSF